MDVQFRSFSPVLYLDYNVGEFAVASKDIWFTFVTPGKIPAFGYAMFS
jgi:hypothetical protein